MPWMRTSQFEKSQTGPCTHIMLYVCLTVKTNVTFKWEKKTGLLMTRFRYKILSECSSWCRSSLNKWQPRCSERFFSYKFLRNLHISHALSSQTPWHTKMSTFSVVHIKFHKRERMCQNVIYAMQSQPYRHQRIYKCKVSHVLVFESSQQTGKL